MMMDNILYIFNSDIISEKIINEIKNRENYFVIPLNIHVKKFLEKHNIKNICERDILDFKDYEYIDEIAYNISKNWCKNNSLEDILDYHEINLGSMLQAELRQRLLKYIHRIRLIEKILEKIQPKLVFTTYADDVLNKIPYNFCISQGIKTEILHDLSIETTVNRFEKINFAIDVFGKTIDFNLSRNQFAKLKKLYEFYWDTRYNFSMLFKKEQNIGNSSILFLDFNLVFHDSLLECFTKNNYNFYFLNNRRPIIWNKNSLKIAKKLQIKKIKTRVTNEEKINLDFEKILKNFKTVLNENFLKENFKIDQYNFWEIFNSELYEMSKKRLKEIISLINKIEYLLNSTKIDLVWVLDDYGADKTVVKVCQNKKIPVCVLLSGSLAVNKPAEKLWFLPFARERTADKLFVWGENDKKHCIECGADLKKIEIGGAPRYDKLFSMKNNSEEYILILTQGFPATAYSQFLSTSLILDFEKLFEKTLSEVKKFNKKIIVKRHPTQGLHEIIDITGMISKIIPEAIVYKNANTLDLISKASVVISVRSTVVDESIILEKPIILLEYLKVNNGKPYASTGAVIPVYDPEQIHQAIHDSLFDNDTRLKLKDGRKKFLEKTFSFQGVASERHVDSITQLLNDKTNFSDT